MVHKSAPFYALLIAVAATVALGDNVLASVGIVGGRPRQRASAPPPVVKRDTVPPGKLPVMPAWLHDYAEALHKAKAEQKMLLVHFCKDSDANCAAIERTLTVPQLRHTLQRYVLARVSTEAAISQQGKQVRLLEHSSFGELRGGPGLAVIDMVHKQQPFYGHVVSAVPTVSGGFYQFRPEHVPAVLDLPPGTLTQRTMIFAVRTHPERPASTHGEADPVLIDEAAKHSDHQARIRNQGHHGWGGRFQRIIGRLAGRNRFGAPVEIVAESWPGQTLTDACVDCVQSWRQSSGHWRNVKTHHASYGYDIRQGANGIWYATGIFSN
jgi:hypothetical protein